MLDWDVNNESQGGLGPVMMGLFSHKRAMEDNPKLKVTIPSIADDTNRLRHMGIIMATIRLDGSTLSTAEISLVLGVPR